MNGNHVNRIARRLAQQQLEKQTHTIAILHREQDGKKVFQWGSNSGDWYSPEFSDVYDAIRYAETMGLKKQDA